MQPRIFLRPTFARNEYVSVQKFTDDPHNIDGLLGSVSKLPLGSSTFRPMYTRRPELTDLVSVDELNAHAFKSYETAEQMYQDYLKEAADFRDRVLRETKRLMPPRPESIQERPPSLNEKIRSVPSTISVVHAASPLNIEQDSMHLNGFKKNSPRVSREVNRNNDKPSSNGQSLAHTRPGGVDEFMAKQLDLVRAYFGSAPKSDAHPSAAQRYDRPEEIYSAKDQEPEVTKVGWSAQYSPITALKASTDSRFQMNFSDDDTGNRRTHANSYSRNKCGNPESVGPDPAQNSKAFDLGVPRMQQNQALSSKFLDSMLRLEYLSRQEQDLSKAAHFASILQGEREQSRAKEISQASTIQLLLKRINELEGQVASDYRPGDPSAAGSSAGRQAWTPVAPGISVNPQMVNKGNIDAYNSNIVDGNINTSIQPFPTVESPDFNLTESGHPKVVPGRIPLSPQKVLARFRQGGNPMFIGPGADDANGHSYNEQQHSVSSNTIDQTPQIENYLKPSPEKGESYRSENQDMGPEISLSRITAGGSDSRAPAVRVPSENPDYQRKLRREFVKASGLHHSPLPNPSYDPIMRLNVSASSPDRMERISREPDCTPTENFSRQSDAPSACTAQPQLHLSPNMNSDEVAPSPINTIATEDSRSFALADVTPERLASNAPVGLGNPVIPLHPKVEEDLLRDPNARLRDALGSLGKDAPMKGYAIPSVSSSASISTSQPSISIKTKSSSSADQNSTNDCHHTSAPQRCPKDLSATDSSIDLGDDNNLRIMDFNSDMPSAESAAVSTGLLKCSKLPREDKSSISAKTPSTRPDDSEQMKPETVKRALLLTTAKSIPDSPGLSDEDNFVIDGIRIPKLSIGDDNNDDLPFRAAAPVQARPGSHPKAMFTALPAKSPSSFPTYDEDLDNIEKNGEAIDLNFENVQNESLSITGLSVSEPKTDPRRSAKKISRGPSTDDIDQQANNNTGVTDSTAGRRYRYSKGSREPVEHTGNSLRADGADRMLNSAKPQSIVFSMKDFAHSKPEEQLQKPSASVDTLPKKRAVDLGNEVSDGNKGMHRRKRRAKKTAADTTTTVEPEHITEQDPESAVPSSGRRHRHKKPHLERALSTEQKRATSTSSSGSDKFEILAHAAAATISVPESSITNLPTSPLDMQEPKTALTVDNAPRPASPSKKISARSPLGSNGLLRKSPDKQPLASVQATSPLNGSSRNVSLVKSAGASLVNIDESVLQGRKSSASGSIIGAQLDISIGVLDGSPMQSPSDLLQTGCNDSANSEIMDGLRIKGDLPLSDVITEETEQSGARKSTIEASMPRKISYTLPKEPYSGAYGRTSSVASYTVDLDLNVSDSRSGVNRLSFNELH